MDFFPDVRHMHKAPEAASYAIIFHVLPMWQGLKLKLARMLTGFIARQEYTKELSTRLGAKISKMEMHGLFVASCVLHPGMHSLDCISQNETQSSTYFEQGYNLICSLLAKNPLPSQKTVIYDTSTSTAATCTTIADLGDRFSIRNNMSFAYRGGKQGDISRFPFFPTPARVLRKLAWDRLEILRFWHLPVNLYTRLSMIALREFFIPCLRVRANGT